MFSMKLLVKYSFIGGSGKIKLASELAYDAIQVDDFTEEEYFAQKA